jgi:hypothetical protein
VRSEESASGEEQTSRRAASGRRGGPAAPGEEGKGRDAAKAWRLSACSAVRDAGSAAGGAAATPVVTSASLPRRDSSRASPLAAAAAAAAAAEGGGVCDGRLFPIVLSCFPSSAPVSSLRFLLALLPSFFPPRADLERDSNASKAHEESEPGRTDDDCPPSIPPQKPEQSSEGCHGSSTGLGPRREGADFDVAPREGVVAIGQNRLFCARRERRDGGGSYRGELASKKISILVSSSEFEKHRK